MFCDASDCDGDLMALSINSPADISVIEGQAVNIPWVASGGSESANYPVGSVVSGFEVPPPPTSVWVNYEGSGLEVTNISNNQMRIAGGFGGTDRHNSYVVTGENVVRVRSKYLSGAQYSQYVFYTFTGGDTRIWVFFVGFGEIRIYKQKNGGSVSYVTVSGYDMSLTQISDIRFHLKLDGSADYVISIYNADGSHVNTWTGSIANCYQPTKSHNFVFAGSNVDYICQRLELYSGSPVVPSVTYSATTTKNGAPYNTATNTTGIFPLNIPTAQPSDSGTYEIAVANAGASVSDSVEVVVSALVPLQINSPQNVDVTVGSPISIEWLASGGTEQEYTASITKNSIPYSTETNSTGLFSFEIQSAQVVDAGTYEITVVNGAESVADSVDVAVTVPPEPEQYCDDSAIRYLFEMSARERWEPSLSSSTIFVSQFGVVSFFQCGAPADSYWIDWGGTYDNPEIKRFEVFLKQYLTPVNSLSELLLVPYSLFQLGSKVYFNTPLYPWKYSRFYSFIASVFGFSSSVRDSKNPSDDTFDGIRYPVRLQIPSLGLSQLPDPVSGVIALPAFSVTLDNSDGYFDLFDTQRFFNSLVRLKKSTKSRPNLADYKTIRTAYVDSVEITFSDYRIKSFEPTRAFTQEVCSVFIANQFPNMNDDIVGDSIPIGYGPINGCKLIEISSFGGAFRYISLDPEYLTAVNKVYDSDGASVTFSNIGGVITTSVEADRADVVGKMPCTIADIVVAEIVAKANQQFVPGVWDISEVERYRAISPCISLYFEKGNLKKLIEDAVKNDSAFVFTKNSGELTIRRFGLTYDYHEISGWKITQQPVRSFSDSKDFCSSAVVDYLYDFNLSETTKTYLYDDQESSVFDIYTKTNRRRFSTSITEKIFAEDLAIRQFTRFSKRFEMVKVATGYDCSEVNPLDSVKTPISVNGRLFSTVKEWIVRSCDPAQDKLDLEESTPLESFIGGTMSFPSIENESGVMSHISTSGISGELVFPSIQKGK